MLCCFSKVISESLDNCDFVDPQDCFCRLPYHTWLSSNRNCQIRPSKKQEYFGANFMCPIKTESLSAY